MLPCPDAGRAPPFPADEKEEKILKIPSFRPQATTGPGLPSTRDRPALLSPSGEVGDLRTEKLDSWSIVIHQQVLVGWMLEFGFWNLDFGIWNL